MVVIKRTYGNHFDYLSAWDDKSGATCRSFECHALMFQTEEEAIQAAQFIPLSRIRAAYS